MDSPHSLQDRSKQSASLEERQELSAVVDGKVVSDEHPLPKSVDATMSTLDKIVMAVVIVGIIVFASFQISQCVASYANPATQTSVANVNRTYPGIMLCPFSYDVYGQVGICPTWSPQASLAFDFNDRRGQDSGPGNVCPPNSIVSVSNTNSDRAAQNLRSNSCPLNQGNLIPDASTLKPAIYVGIYRPPCFTQLQKLVTVKNSARPTTDRNSRTGPSYTCNSWTPPNVECLVFDASSFDEAANTNPDLKPICNPMREVKSNAENSVGLNVRFDTYDCGSRCDYSTYGFYKYSGLIPQTSIPPGLQSNPFITAPSSLSSYTRDLVQQGKVSSCSRNVNISLFGGIVAVLYDASKGTPQELDFDGARTNQMSDSDLGSTVLLSTNAGGNGVVQGSGPFCAQYEPPPVSATVTSQVDERFTNAVTGAKLPFTSQTVSLQTSIIDGTSLRGGDGSFQLSMRFSSSVSVVTSPIISLTILTTISIILSTAATLWGSQQKIKEGIILATTKVKEFLDKRRAV